MRFGRGKFENFVSDLPLHSPFTTFVCIFVCYVPPGVFTWEMSNNKKHMAFFKEFKEFALKGNVMDMAVGVIIGSAFGKIVTSLVNDVLMPPIGVFIGNADFSNLKLDISRVRDTVAAGTDFITHDAAAAEAVREPVYLHYGAFLQQCIDFAILALCVFLMVKLMNRITRKKEVPAPAPAPPAPTREEQLLAEIRDLLKQRNRQHDF